MRKRILLISLLLAALTASAVTEITKNGITWKFDSNVQSGQFCNGDYWVVGPVNIIEISNPYHPFEPGLDGSMINPGAGSRQGYDNRLRSYASYLNVAETEISRSNPLALTPNSSLISTASWRVGDAGCPKINGGTKMPRPILRAGAVLTCLPAAPPAGSFRPPYCGSDKSIRFNNSDLDRSKLPSLSAVPGTPDAENMARRFENVWIEHIHQYLGAMCHPSENMPEYGENLSKLVGEAALLLMTDAPKKDQLLINFVQLGIDLAGVADAGGGWPSNGGHHQGRKWPILFAGVMLNDSHMSSVGQWDTVFQEDRDTFYVSQTEVDITHGSSWNPDKRGEAEWPYEKKHIGLPEWGIRHAQDPWADQLHWTATYRSINNSAYPAWTLAALIMGQREAWNHEPLFDYVDRAVAAGSLDRGRPILHNSFVAAMWRKYRDNYPPVWTPDNPGDPYSHGKQK